MQQKGDASSALVEIEQETIESIRMIGLPMAYHALGFRSRYEAAQGNIKTAFCCPLIIAVPAIWPRLLMSFAAITSFASMVTIPF